MAVHTHSLKGYSGKCLFSVTASDHCQEFSDMSTPCRSGKSCVLLDGSNEMESSCVAPLVVHILMWQSIKSWCMAIAHGSWVNNKYDEHKSGLSLVEYSSDRGVDLQLPLWQRSQVQNVSSFRSKFH